MVSKRKPKPLPKKYSAQQEAGEDLKKTIVWKRIFIGFWVAVGSILATIAAVTGYTIKDFIKAKEPNKEEQPIVKQPETINPDTLSKNSQIKRRAPISKKLGLPRVLLLSTPGKLDLHNLGKNDLYLWGTKIGKTAPIIEKEPRIILPGTFYYFLTDNLRINGRQSLVPFEVYLSDPNKCQYIANFDLLIIGEGQNFEIHTQQKGVREENWQKF